MASQSRILQAIKDYKNLNIYFFSFFPFLFLKISFLKTYVGRIDDLGEVEQFYYHLIQLPNFDFRIEAMVLKGDFDGQIAAIKEDFKLLHRLFKLFDETHSIKTFLRYVLHTGTFLNQVIY